MRTIRIDTQGGVDYLYNDDEQWKDFVHEDFNQTFVIHGNHDYKEIEETDWFDTVKNLMKDFDESDLDDEEDAKLLRENYTKYSDEQWKSIVEIYQNCKYSDSDDTYLKVLHIIYPNDKWERGTICGYCQSDWNNVLYKANDIKNLDLLEAYYFGMVADIYDETEGVSAVVTNDTLWKAQRENTLRELINELLDIPKDEEIEVYESDGYIQQTKWKQVSC